MLMRTATQGARASQQFPIWGTAGNPIAGSIDLMGARMSYARNVEIYGEGEPAEYYRNMFDLMALAFDADITRSVVCLTCSS